MKTTRSDFALTVPAEGVIGLQKYINALIGGSIDIGSVKGAGFSLGYVPVWNGTKFVPGNITSIAGYTPSTPDGGGSTIQDLDIPGVATRRQPPGLPYGPTQDVWMQEVFDVRQYGAWGSGTGDITPSVNKAIAALNAAGRGALYYPAGEYYHSDYLIEIEVPCAVYGDGAGASKLHFSRGGFIGGSAGQAFEVCELAMISDGTSAETGISLTDGTSVGAGEAFSFHDLNMQGWPVCISVDAANRRGFIFNSRLTPTLTGVDLSAKGCILSDLLLINDGTTSTLGISLVGDGHRLHGNTILTDSVRWIRGIDVISGNYLSIADHLIVGCVNEAVLLTGSGATSGCRLENIQFSDIQGAAAVGWDVTQHYVSDLQGLGSNTDTTYDSRRELQLFTTWDPPSLRPLESAWEDFTLTGAQVGDQVALGGNPNGSFWNMSARVSAANTVRVTVQNLTASTVDLASAALKIRIFN